MLMGDPYEWATDYIAHWVKDGAIGSAFNYPMSGALRRSFRVRKGRCLGAALCWAQRCAGCHGQRLAVAVVSACACRRGRASRTQPLCAPQTTPQTYACARDATQAPALQAGGLDSLKSFAEKRAYWLKVFGDQAHQMGSITDSHDIPRWLAQGNDDVSRYK
jgi:hypothetical protein